MLKAILGRRQPETEPIPVAQSPIVVESDEPYPRKEFISPDKSKRFVIYSASWGNVLRYDVRIPGVRHDQVPMIDGRQEGYFTSVTVVETLGPKGYRQDLNIRAIEDDPAEVYSSNKKQKLEQVNGNSYELDGYHRHGHSTFPAVPLLNVSDAGLYLQSEVPAYREAVRVNVPTTIDLLCAQVQNPANVIFTRPTIVIK